MAIKILKITAEVVPIVVLIGLIPFVKDEYTLSALYAGIVFALLWYKRDRHDVLAFVLGACSMTIAEYFFVKTGVEQFTMHTLLGVMPLWLPILWGYGFVVIKRALRIIS